jgi:hypothetical protein
MNSDFVLNIFTQELFNRIYVGKCTINSQWKKSLYCWHRKNFPKKYLRQPSIDFDFCNISSSCDVVYKGRWLTQAGYWFILWFCEHFTCLSSKIQNAIKLKNISNLITSPSSYQCIRRKTWKLSIINNCSSVRYYVWQLRSAILLAREMMNEWTPTFLKIFLCRNCSILHMGWAFIFEFYPER